jgi:protein gp37
MANGKQPIILGPDGRASSGERMTMDRLRRDLFRLIDQTPNLDWILCTKRPENIRRIWPWTPNCPRNIPNNYYHNVWLLTSVENQETADTRIPHLLNCRELVPVLGLSCEPLLGPLNLQHEWLQQLSWLIVGGESGPRARPCDVRWIESLLHQGQAAGVQVFVKQLGAHVFDAGTTSATTFPEAECWPEGTATDYHRVLLRHPKGGDWAEWPEDLRVREVPQLPQNT